MAVRVADSDLVHDQYFAHDFTHRFEMRVPTGNWQAGWDGDGGHEEVVARERQALGAKAAFEDTASNVNTLMDVGRDMKDWEPPNG